jgi:hypothetical protein
MNNSSVKNVLSALAVAAVSFALLNLTFLLFAALAQIFESVPNSGSPQLEPEPNLPVAFVIGAVVIGFASKLVFCSKLNIIFKAAFLTVPAAVILVLIGVAFYPWPVIPYLFGGLLILGFLYYLYRTKRHWLYQYAVMLIAFVLAIMGLTGMEI